MCLPRPQWFRQPKAWACALQISAPFPSVRAAQASRGLGALSPDVCLFPLRKRPRPPEAWEHFPRMRRAFSLGGERLSKPEAWARSLLMRYAFSLRGEQLRQPEASVHSPWMRRTFSLRGPSARRRSGLRKSSDRNWGPVCHVGGGGFSGAEFAPFPSPLPPTSSGDGPALLWSFSVPFANRRQCVRAS